MRMEIINRTNLNYHNQIISLYSHKYQIKTYSRKEIEEVNLFIKAKKMNKKDHFKNKLKNL